MPAWYSVSFKSFSPQLFVVCEFVSHTLECSFSCRKCKKCIIYCSKFRYTSTHKMVVQNKVDTTSTHKMVVQNIIGSSFSLVPKKTGNRVQLPKNLVTRPWLPVSWALGMPWVRSTLQVGEAARPGQMCTTVCAPRNATCPNLARGARDGSIMVPAPAQPTFARPSCCPPCRPLHRPCCVRNPGRMLPHGSAPSPARLAPPCRPTACSSLCVGGCDCPCQSPRTDVVRTGTAAAPLSTPLAITMPRAPAPACSPVGRSLSNMPGLSDPRARSSRSSGWRVRQPRVSTLPIAAA